MTLVRAFSRVGGQGEIVLPANIRTQAKLKAGQIVEIKLCGASKAKKLVVSPRQNFR